MIWERGRNQLVPIRENSEMGKMESSSESDKEDNGEKETNKEMKKLRLENKIRRKIIDKRNQFLDEDFMGFVQGKYRDL
jgi:hypothetical protein